ncbi:hypothetical protein Vadar_031655 [Vaccinium darrowii]|uniref:Uncharacterized protein n=1 Tax=Vaccinium darrowii TaxID=229202 RepID=A0ACB7XW62_9ERIC|nr:hypothetical protein Vadar_031655 [Vaccinium darrowii]
MAHWFVLNSAEIRHYLEQHKSQSENESAFDIPKRQQEEFPNWFKNHTNQLRVQGSLEAIDELWSIANGPLVNVNIYSGCISNGVRFHFRDRDGRHKSQNSGVVVEGEHEGKTVDCYGYLCRDPEIIPSSVVLQLDNEEHQDTLDDEEDESMGEPTEDEENELPWESDSDIDPNIKPCGPKLHNKKCRRKGEDEEQNPFKVKNTYYGKQKAKYLGEPSGGTSVNQGRGGGTSGRGGGRSAKGGGTSARGGGTSARSGRNGTTPASRGKAKAVELPQPERASKRLKKVGEGWILSQQSTTNKVEGPPSKLHPIGPLMRNGILVSTKPFVSSQASTDPGK